MKLSILFFAAALSGGLLFSACSKSKAPEEETTKPVQNETVPDNFPLVGFATLNGGTTGGATGQTVTATTFAELKSYLENTSPLIVKLGARIYNGEKGGKIDVNSNKTLLGIGANAFLDGIGLNISSKSNIIIRNVKISLVSITNTSDPAVYDPDGDEGRAQIIVNGGDCISVQGNSSRVWIDHCEFYAVDPAIQTNIDLYDGLIDVKSNSAYITISWNYFHDHHKTHLIGSSDTDNFDRKITFHHNYYFNIGSRIPSYRFGSGHFYNNYLKKISGSGINSRMGAVMKVENNVFENVNTPITVTGTPVGTYELIGNQFSNVTGIAPPTTSTGQLRIPYSYSADAASSVVKNVTEKAGVGKL